MEDRADVLGVLAARTKTKADEALEQDPGKISATGALGRWLTYTGCETGGSDYGPYVRVTFINEVDEPGWFFSSSDSLIGFFIGAKEADAFPFVARLHKGREKYDKMWIEVKQ